MVFKVWKINLVSTQKEISLGFSKDLGEEVAVLTCHSLSEDHRGSFRCTEFATASIQPHQQETLTESDALNSQTVSQSSY